MHDSDLRLDGNAVAGVLDEVLGVEATTVIVTCAACGDRGALGAAHVYAHGPGVVLRCQRCAGVLMRFASLRGRFVMDLRGCVTVALDLDAR